MKCLDGEEREGEGRGRVNMKEDEKKEEIRRKKGRCKGRDEGRRRPEEQKIQGGGVEAQRKRS